MLCYFSCSWEGFKDKNVDYDDLYALLNLSELYVLKNTVYSTPLSMRG